MVLHGRDAEIRAVSSALEAAAAGATRAILVVGEAGIGKTALLAAATERARDGGLVVLHARAVEQERDVPFALAAAALEEHADLDELEAELHGPGERFRHHRVLRALV